jgi:predicted RNA-binding Zn ribbon-like protein
MDCQATDAAEGDAVITARAPFPADWLPAVQAAGDVDLALLLVNSVDLLESPPDRLSDLSWLSAAFGAAGHADLAAQLKPADLPLLRSLREALRAAFVLEEPEHVAAELNPWLASSRGPVLVPVDGSGDRLRLQVAPGLTGYAALAARLPAAVAVHLATYGTGRLGACASDPCRCVFVDRTRAGTRRYCCGYCNDRAAARSYRRRRSQA